MKSRFISLCPTMIEQTVTTIQSANVTKSIRDSREGPVTDMEGSDLEVEGMRETNKTVLD